MESLALLPRPADEAEGTIEVLIADDDVAMRSWLATRAREAVGAAAVHEAADGAEAVQIGLQQRPQIALIDVGMPLLGGMEVALVLRELVPGVRLALFTGDPAAHSDDARELCLPLFDKLQSDRVLGWLEGQARRVAGA